MTKLKLNKFTNKYKSLQTDNKINFGAGGNRKKAKVSLAKVRLKDSEEDGGMK